MSRPRRFARRSFDSVAQIGGEFPSMHNRLEKSSVAQNLDGGPSDGESACPRLPNIRPSLVPRQAPGTKKGPSYQPGCALPQQVAATSRERLLTCIPRPRAAKRDCTHLAIGLDARISSAHGDTQAPRQTILGPSSAQHSTYRGGCAWMNMAFILAWRQSSFW